MTGLKDNGLSIYIDKRIPIQAGLAGGSADAAAVIVGLNEIYQAKLPQSKLCEIGLLCGADVPFCIVGGCCLAQGIGEELTKIPHNNGFFVVIAKPKIGVSTKKAFWEYDNYNGDIIRPNTKTMLNAISNNEIAEIGNNMINVFEQIRFMQEIEDLKHIMLNNHA